MRVVTELLVNFCSCYSNNLKIITAVPTAKNEIVSYYFNLRKYCFEGGVDLISRGDISASPTQIYRMHHGVHNKFNGVMN